VIVLHRSSEHYKPGINRSALLLSHQIPFKKNSLLHGIIGGFIVLWGLLAIRPSDWRIWLLENSLLVGFIVVLALAYRSYPLSNLSYLLIAVFLLLHAVGAHYTYQNTPVDVWAKRIFHVKRGIYDRIVHLAFGLMLVLPVREVLSRFMKLRNVRLYIVTFTILLAASGLYELAEAWLALLADPQLAAAYVGLEGDPFDSQKDMTMALVGVLLTIGLISMLQFLAKRRNRRYKGRTS
jgi:putative membrane protein